MLKTTIRLALLAVSFVAVQTALTSVSFAAAPVCGAGGASAATGEPILLGGIVGRTGPDDFSAPAKAAAAYFKCVNAQGGIHGRPIQYAVEDDQWNPETALQLATSLVNDRKVLALVGGASFVSCGANGALLKSTGTVDVAGMAPDRACFNDGNIYPMNLGPQRSLIAIADFALAKFQTKGVLVIAMNQPGVAWVLDPIKQWGIDHNVATQQLLFDPQSADPGSFALQIAQAKADTVLVMLPKALTVAVLSAAEQQDLGSRLHFLSGGAAYSEEVPKVVGPYWNDRLYISLEFSPVDSDAAGVVDWRGVLDAYGSPSDPRDALAEGGFVAAKVVTDTLLSLDPAKIDRAHLADALRSVHDFKSDLLCAPMSLADSRTDGHNGNQFGRVAVASGGAWKPAGDCVKAALPGEK